MILRFEPYQLQLKHPFRLATGTRTSTSTVQVQIEENGIIGYGEASMPPYLGESIESVTSFLLKLKSENWQIENLSAILQEIDSLSEKDNAAKAAIDIALHDLKGKILGVPTRELFGITATQTPPTAMTIGMGTEAELRQKVAEAENFQLLKIKLGGPDDKDKIDFLRSITDKPFLVDANQGWTDVEVALRMIDHLSSLNVLMVEQPMPVNTTTETWRLLKEKSALPIFADESVKRLADLENVSELFHGINIKLMKSTGLAEANAMFDYCHKTGLQTMIGCMTESSCAIMAAAQLASRANFVDLDGPFLISNNPFEEPQLIGGCIQLDSIAGNGVIPF
ncbi:MAG: dipeptide epimerase [Flavobacteriales bacterium]|jgi:L-alanine-DL-glutamate epimerase-like enolase superfamily enzyme|nr:dipeptide epimerase [Flavobacteriales bacterium]